MFFCAYVLVSFVVVAVKEIFVFLQDMSRFLKNTDEYVPETAPGIDFGAAVRLPADGSTCDIFRTKWQRREVFVKRLKEEYRSMPLYLDALDKEFDIGVSLRHPSLPEYREFHRDYIVMDFIDGQTLAEMIRDRDPWLSNESHIVTMLRQLVDVVNYLHRHNVVHCDIKPDNIMITSDSKNLVLIDFDKCYTDALNDTPGDPGKYGLPADKAGKSAIDFHGIGRVVEKLRDGLKDFDFPQYRKFVKTCYAPDADSEKLRAILDDGEKSSNRLALIVGSGMVLTGLLIGVVGYLSERNESRDYASTENVSGDTISANTVGDEGNMRIDTMASGQMQIFTKNDSQAALSAGKQEESSVEKLDPSLVLEKYTRPYFDKMIAGLDHLDILQNDSTITREQLKDSISSYEKFEHDSFSDVSYIVTEIFPDITAPEMGDVISGTPSYRRYIHRAGIVKSALYEKLYKRHKNN